MSFMTILIKKYFFIMLNAVFAFSSKELYEGNQRGVE